MLLVLTVLAVVMVGPLLLERLERHVLSPPRPVRSTVDSEAA